MGLLIDSTVFIHAERRRQSPAELLREIFDRFGDTELALSVMSAGELFHGCWRANTPSRRAQRAQFVETILGVIPPIPVELGAMRVFGEVDARLRAERQVIPTADLLIGCTAMLRGDAVLTGNVRHFRSIPDLVVYELA